MNTVEVCTSAEAVEGLLQLVQANSPIVDVTYGNGLFWEGSTRQVIGLDRNPSRAKSVCADFFNLPFANQAIPTVVYDPPFHPFVGSAEEARFSGMGKNEKELKQLFQLGTKEAWRITSEFLILKCQGYIHNHRPQWMPLWAIDVIGDPFEWLTATRGHKRISGRWVANKSLRRNHADYLVFSRKGNHR